MRRMGWGGNRKQTRQGCMQSDYFYSHRNLFLVVGVPFLTCNLDFCRLLTSKEDGIAVGHLRYSLASYQLNHEGWSRHYKMN
jgi:hypothetical protein